MFQIALVTKLPLIETKNINNYEELFFSKFFFINIRKKQFISDLLSLFKKKIRIYYTKSSSGGSEEKFTFKGHTLIYISIYILAKCFSTINANVNNMCILCLFER